MQLYHHEAFANMWVFFILTWENTFNSLKKESVPKKQNTILPKYQWCLSLKQPSLTAFSESQNQAKDVYIRAESLRCPVGEWLGKLQPDSIVKQLLFMVLLSITWKSV